MTRTVRRNAWFGLILCLMLFLFLPCASAQTVVSPEDLHHETLQAVIDRVPIGDVLVLQAGDYTANLILHHAMTLVAEPGVTIRPEDPSQPAVLVEDVTGVLIRGLAIEDAGVGCEISQSSCSLEECTIRDSETGVRILSFSAGPVIVHACTIEQAQIGLHTFGSGSVLISDCRIRDAGVGIMISATGTLLADHVDVSLCYDGIVLVDSARTVLFASSVHDNVGSGIRLSKLPDELAGFADDGSLYAVDCEFTNNTQWGISYSSATGMACCETPGATRISGQGNVLSGNGSGPQCPDGLLPVGFLASEETTE